MKHLIVIISVLLAQTAFAQRFELQTYKPSKDIQNEVHEWDDRNIIAQIQNGTVFQIMKKRRHGDYVWAYFNGMEGWVNKKYTQPFRP